MTDRVLIVRQSRRLAGSRHTLPCWAISLGIHGLLALCLVASLHRAGTPDGSGGNGNPVGIKLDANFGEALASDNSEVNFTAEAPENIGDPPAQPTEQPSPDEQPPPTEVADGSTAAEPPADPPLEEGPTKPPRRQSEPGELTSTVPGSPTKSALASLLADVRTDRLRADGEAAGGGGEGGDIFGNPDGTSFFQVGAQGQHFCYVVDCSNSMDDDNTIDVARAELNASLRRLDSRKQFQIVFYDSELHRLISAGKTVFFATDANRKLAQQFINNQQPTGRASHRTALMAALQSKPDVIFFLTDGEVPELTARDLYDLKSSNRRRTQIHVIEFGRGAKLEKNWLDQLARDHRGSHRYRNIELQDQ